MKPEQKQDAKTDQASRPGQSVDVLLAKYAPIGRRLRRKRLIRRWAAIGALPVLAALGFQAWQWTTARPATGPVAAAESPAQAGTAGDTVTRVENALAEFRELKAQVSAESGALGAQREEVAKQRQQFEQRSALLMQQLNQINAQGVSLAGQLQRFENQRMELEETLARADAERRALDTRQARAAQATGPALEQQLAEISRQRRSFEEQQEVVRQQGRQLAQEIERINAQRLELERQREAIEQQRAEVQGLLKQVQEVSLNRQRGKQRSIDALAAAKGNNTAAPAALAAVAAVNDEVLGEMRGALDVSQDFSVSIGVTRTGTVNGIEQFTSALYIDDLTKYNGGGGGATMPQIDTAMIQNGIGNTISPETMATLAQNVSTVLQNTLDNQAISSQTIIDISLQNMSSLGQSISASQAATESLSLQH